MVPLNVYIHMVDISTLTLLPMYINVSEKCIGVLIFSRKKVYKKKVYTLQRFQNILSPFVRVRTCAGSK